VWLRFLWKHGFRVAWQRWPMAFAITLLGVFNSALAWLQCILYAGRFRAETRLEPPIFILGHWRSGTTHLHELLVHDPRLGYPNTYECFAPAHFLVSEWLAPLVAFLLPAKRPMDNMTAGWEHPQEDEFALCNLGVGSPYSMIGFPNLPPTEDGFLELRGLSPDELNRWRNGLTWFLERVAYRHKKRLVLKSPPHTARVRILKELFPQAKFIHIVRDPLAVYPSTIRLWKSLCSIQALQIPDFHGLEENVLEGFCRMYDQFEQDRGLLDERDFFELRYEDLVRDPINILRELYEKLELGDFSQAETALAAYLETQRSYQTNKHQVSPEEQQRIERLWGPYMRKYGYLQSAAPLAAKA
jgi:hypothetical protein